MFLQVCAVYEDVVEVDDDEPVDEFAEDGIDVALEVCRSVGESKWPDEPFEESVASAKCRFPFVNFGDSDSMVRPLKVNFCVVLGVCELIEEHVGRGKGIAILDGHVVESAVVDAKSGGGSL